MMGRVASFNDPFSKKGMSFNTSMSHIIIIMLFRTDAAETLIKFSIQLTSKNKIQKREASAKAITRVAIAFIFVICLIKIQLTIILFCSIGQFTKFL